MRVIIVFALTAPLLLACRGGDAGRTSTAPAPTATREAVSLPLEPERPALYLVNADGTGLRKLVDDAGYQLAVSPDGRRAATVLATLDEAQVYVIDTATGEGRQIARVAGYVSLGEWSPDGGRLAFTMQEPSSGGPSSPPPSLYVYEVESGEVTDLIAAPDTHLQGWSADGAAVFILQATDSPVLRRVDLATGQTTDVASDVGFGGFAVSPDGEKVAIATFEAEPMSGTGTYTIEVARPDGSERRELLRLEDTFVLSGLAWSPDGRWLVYGRLTAADQGVDSGIFTVDVASGATTRITQAPAAPEGVDTEADWSPAGDRLLVRRRVCTQCDGGGSKVVLAAADGSGETSLPGNEQFLLGGASWSPDGTRLAYGADKLYVANADGSGARPIVDLPGFNYEPLVWAAGEAIVFVAIAVFPPTAYAVAPDGSDLAVLGVGALSVAPDGETVLGQDGDGLYVRLGDREPVRLHGAALEEAGLTENVTPQLVAWSPDSRWAFVAFHPKGGTALAIASRDGEVRVAAPAGWEGDVRWSPDGTRVAYWSDGAIWSVAPDSGEPQRLIDLPSVGGLDWSPDGRQIAFFDFGQIKAIAADGSAEPELLFQTNLSSAGPPITLRWSPDGERIAISDGNQLFVGAVGADRAVRVADATPYGLFGFDWTQDGSAIAYGTRDPSHPNQSPAVFVVDADGGAALLLARSSGRLFTVLGRLADGRIVFVSQFTL